MKISEVNYSGKLFINSEIDFSKTTEEQEWELVEDILYVEYENNITLDIGWLPEFDPRGKFLIHVVNGSNWDTPIIKQEILYNDFLQEIESVIAKIKTQYSLS